MSPGAQEVHSVGLEVEQVAHDLSHCTQFDPERAKPWRQLVQTVADEHPEHPVGQRIGVLPTTAVAMLVEGLVTQALDPSREKPESQSVQTVDELQVRQLSEQAEQAPLDKKYLEAQEVQAELEVQVRQLAEQDWQAVPLSKEPSWHLQVVPSKICKVLGQDVGAMHDKVSLARVK